MAARLLQPGSHGFLELCEAEAWTQVGCVPQMLRVQTTAFSRFEQRRVRRGMFTNHQNGLNRKMDVVCMAKKEKKSKGGGKKAANEAEVAAPPPVIPYTDGDIIIHSLSIIDSYYRSTGKQIFPEKVEIPFAAKALWELPQPVISHGTEDDPIFNYANKAALEVFGVDWAAFTSMPSRKYAPEEEQADRNQLLASALTAAADLKGIERITPAGRKFRVLEGVLWPLTDLNGENYGQAAMFFSVEFHDEEKKEGDEKASASADPPLPEQEQTPPLMAEAEVPSNA